MEFIDYKKELVLLMIPGPVPIHPRVYRAMMRPIYGHRTSEFRGLYDECVNLIKKLLKTDNDVFILAGSGTSVMDAAIANLVSPGDKVLNIINGKFGHRWKEITESYGGISIPLEFEWGKGVDVERVKEILEENPDIKFVTLTHNETSTGVLNPGEEIGRVVKEYGKLLIVDGITSVGGDYVYPDEWGFDVLVTGSQKCLGAPPGLGIIMLNERAWEVIDKRDEIRSYYLNMKNYKRSYEKNRGDAPFTASVSLIYALKESLDMIFEEGFENRVKRHRKMAKMMREAMTSLGLELLAERGFESNTLTAVKYPKGVEDKEFRESMLKHGVMVAGGQNRLKGKIFRVAHMNLISEREVLTTVATVELVLKELGYHVELGSGVRAAQEAFLRGR
ncbi:MAG: pyridoxal-phosphate-dependent aminotransferase family protein [Candidatus Asgardarchaeia archaeon]